jgi:hypothetical protein
LIGRGTSYLPLRFWCSAPEVADSSGGQAGLAYYRTTKLALAEKRRGPAIPPPRTFSPFSRSIASAGQKESAIGSFRTNLRLDQLARDLLPAADGKSTTCVYAWECSDPAPWETCSRAFHSYIAVNTLIMVPRTVDLSKETCQFCEQRKSPCHFLCGY